ncbi:MAG: hypothetical protein JKY52_05030 [Flavobacteriales bacterium]|nr:hypothetical protein [Flavobacteriales bacterium]
MISTKYFGYSRRIQPGTTARFTFLCIAVWGSLVLSTDQAQGQEMMGLNGSNYAGTAGAHINPSSLSNFPHKWEVHLLTLDFMVDNNYAHMPKTSLMSEYKRSKNLGSNYELQQSDFVYPQTSFSKKSAYVNVLLKVPSVLFRIKDHRFALINNGARFITSANHVNFTVPKFLDSEGDSLTLDFSSANLDISKFRINAMAWAEYGITYSTLISQTNSTKTHIGISIKRLHGFASGFLLNNGVAFDFTPQQTALTRIDVEYGYIDVQNLGGNSAGYQGLISGKGMGFDLGATFVMKRKYRTGGIDRVELGRNHPTNYGTRIGISLIDMGRINFDSNVQKFKVDKFTRNDSIADMDVLVNSELYQFPDQSQPGAQFSMRLPTALSVQVDYKIRRNVFVNATAIQRIVLPGPGIDRANQLSITPRFELKWLGFSMPLSLYQFKRPRLGAALRIGPLWIGSDKIGSWFFPGKFSGTDFFISLRILPLHKSKKKKRKRAEKEKRVTDLPCSFMPYRSVKWIRALINNLKRKRKASKFGALNNADHGVPKQ